jgi:hypothetical protein
MALSSVILVLKLACMYTSKLILKQWSVKTANIALRKIAYPKLKYKYQFVIYYL